MSYGELALPPIRTGRNTKTGRFLKGHVPANKGKKWSDYMGKRAQKRAMKGWKNLDLYRGKVKRSGQAGCQRKQVVAVMDDGRWLVFPYADVAARWLGCGRIENIRRCCRENQSRRVRKYDWRKGQPKGSGFMNTDHKYMGIRWYFENDDTWTEKIKQ